MRLIISLFLILWSSAAAVWAAPSISSVSGTYTNGQTITISGSGFGSHADNSGGKGYLPKLWDKFESGSINTNSGYWNLSNAVIASSNNRTNSSYYAHTHAAYGSTNPGNDLATGLDTSQHTLYCAVWRYLSPFDTPALNDGSGYKLFRIYSGAGGQTPDFVWTLRDEGSDTIGTFLNFYCVEGCTPYSGYVSTPETTNHIGHWALWEFYIDFTNNHFTLWLNGKQMDHDDNSVALSTCGLTMYCLTIDTFHSSTGSSTTMYADDDDAYIDYTQARVFISDQATLDTSVESHREIQLPTAWSDGSITCTFNTGSFSTGTVYLYVVDSTGAISNAQEITLGGTAGSENPGTSGTINFHGTTHVQ